MKFTLQILYKHHMWIQLYSTVLLVTLLVILYVWFRELVFCFSVCCCEAVLEILELSWTIIKHI